MLAQQGAQMLPFVLPVENSSAKKGRACAQCIGEAAGGARRVCGASNVKKNHDTLVECRKQKCVCAVQCVMRVSCGEQFTRHMLGVDAGRAVGSQSRAAQRVCQSRWCALSRRGRRWRACDFVGGRSFNMVLCKGPLFVDPRDPWSRTLRLCPPRPPRGGGTHTQPPKPIHLSVLPQRRLWASIAAEPRCILTTL